MAQKNKGSGKTASPAEPSRKNAPTPRGKNPVPKRGFFQRNSFKIGLFLICFLVFGNGIFNQYALDDEFYTAHANKNTQQGLSGLKEIFSTRTFYNNDGTGYSYRPITLTSFALEIQLFGENPETSHFFNVLLYALTIVVLFSLLRRWFPDQGDWFSFFVCLIFLAHPLHTEVVDNIKCRDEILAMLFALLSVRFTWKHMETGRAYFLALAPLMFFLGMLSKHTILPFLALIPLTLWFFSSAGWKKIVLYMLPFLAACVVIVLIQKFALPAQSRVFQDFENPFINGESLPTRVATSFHVLGRYLWLHVFPHPLVYYYGSRYVPTVGWSDITAIVSLIIHLALGLLALRELRKKTILGFGLLFYLINIAVYSNLFRSAPGLMAERFTYAASLGFCIVVVWFIFRLLKKDPAQFRWGLADFKTTRIVLLGLALLFTVRCWFRNEDWESKDVLYANDMVYLHESAKANMLYAALFSMKAMRLHIEAGQAKKAGMPQIEKIKEDSASKFFLDARKYYAQAANIAPYYHTAWGNLGTTYFFTGKSAEALPYFYRAIKENPKYTEGYFNLGMAYAALEKRDSSVYFFNKAILTDSNYLPPYDQLSRIRLNFDHDTAGALAILQASAKARPDSDVPWTNIAAFYTALNDTVSTAGALEMAARINPSNIDRLYNLAMYYRRKNDILKYNEFMSMFQEEQKRQEKLHGSNPQQQQQPRR